MTPAKRLSPRIGGNSGIKVFFFFAYGDLKTLISKDEGGVRGCLLSGRHCEMCGVVAECRDGEYLVAVLRRELTNVDVGKLDASGRSEKCGSNVTAAAGATPASLHYINTARFPRPFSRPRKKTPLNC